jgi:hypothetical protein
MGNWLLSITELPCMGCISGKLGCIDVFWSRIFR